MPLPPRVLSRELRLRTTPDLRRRRWVLGLSLLGTVAAQIVTLFQMGVVRRLPDPPGPFDSSRVDASDYAYSRMQAPDGALMLVSYGVTAALAAKTGWDSFTALKLGQEEWAENRALCAYCQVATLASLASFALALPEAVRATRAATARR